DWNSDRVQRRVIIDNVLIEIGEVIPYFERVGRGENVVRYFRRRVRWKGNIQRPIPDQVEEDAASKYFGCSVLRDLVSKVPAAIDSVGVAEIFDGFLAIKKNKLNSFGQARLLS